MWISAYWYERLPALYALAALLTLALLGTHRAAQMSALLLLGAAGLVRHWRHHHRSAGRPTGTCRQADPR